MKIQSPCELLIDQIRDLYSAEELVANAMPELAAISPNSALSEFFTAQRELSLLQKERLAEVGGRLGKEPGGDICKAMKGLVEGGSEHIQLAEGAEVKGLILIAHMNRIIHYQIAGYEFANALAIRLKFEEVETLLGISLQEERASAKALAALSVPVFGAVE
ncbi:MAG: DUF892 family protein [Luteolibacter sp.]